MRSEYAPMPLLLLVLLLLPGCSSSAGPKGARAADAGAANEWIEH